MNCTNALIDIIYTTGEYRTSLTTTWFKQIRQTNSYDNSYNILTRTEWALLLPQTEGKGNTSCAAYQTQDDTSSHIIQQLVQALNMKVMHKMAVHTA